MNKQTVMRLSKVMSFALRHNPNEFGLVLDEDGWISLDLLIAAIGKQKRWHSITEADVRTVVETSDKQRFELKGRLIRARYGHSRAARPKYEAVEPPPILYHGTPRRNLEQIRQTGLQAMSRQYVHLSATTEMALTVGKRRDQKPALLEIRAIEAYAAGVVFGTPSGDRDNVYLTQSVPAAFIDFPD